MKKTTETTGKTGMNLQGVRRDRRGCEAAPERGNNKIHGPERRTEESPGKAVLKSVLLSAVLLFLCGCRPSAEKAEGPALKLSLAVSPAAYSALVAIADEKGYFKEAGLDVSFSFHPSGLEGLEAVCRGEAQVATVADIAFSAKAAEYPFLRVLASIGTTVGSQIVARKDRNIRRQSDIRGKRVGFSANTVSDYFLYAFLATENIPPKDIAAVALPPSRQAEAIISGEVDAVSAFEIFAYEARNRLAENAVSWDSQNNLAYHWLLASKESVIRSPEPLKRLLRALLRAEGLTRSDEEEAKRILVRKWGFDPEFLRESWARSRLGVSFGQTVVTSLLDHAIWRMRQTGESGDPPDVLNRIHTGIMEEVAPERVTVYR